MNRMLFAYPKNIKLSNGAKGLLVQMANLPECDYKTFDEILTFSVVDNADDVRKYLDELVSNNLLIKLKGSRYAVNKFKLLEMKLFK